VCVYNVKIVRDRIEPSFSAPDEADDAKARSFIEEVFFYSEASH